MAKDRQTGDDTTSVIDKPDATNKLPDSPNDDAVLQEIEQIEQDTGDGDDADDGGESDDDDTI